MTFERGPATNRRAVRPRVALRSSVLCWLALASSVCAQDPPAEAVAGTEQNGAAAEAPILATYRNAVDARELDAFLALEIAASREPRAALRELLLLRAGADEAIRRGLDRQPNVRVELARLEGRLAYAELKRMETADRSIDEAEIEAMLAEFGHRYGKPERYRLRNLLLRDPPAASDEERAEVRNRLETLRRQVLDGTSFSDLATEHSQSTTRLRGGLIGNVEAGTLAPAVEAVAFALEPGEVSEILEVAGGASLLYLESILPPIVRSEEEKRDAIRRLLARRLELAAIDAMDARLDVDAAVDVAWERLGGAGSDDAPVLSAAGESWSRAELLEIVGAASSDLAEDQLTQRVESFARRRQAVRALAALPAQAVRSTASDAWVDARPAMAERLRFERLRILARHALVASVAERLTPPTDAELRAEFARDPDPYRQPASYRLSFLSIDTGPDPRAAATMMTSILDRLRAGETSFAEAARRHSSHPSATSGGALGWLTRRQLPSQLGLDVLRAVLLLEVGETSEPIADGEVLSIVRLEEAAAERPATFDEARAAVDRKLGQARVDRLEAEVLDVWWQRLDVRWSPVVDEAGGPAPVDIEP